ncbi:MAG: hypothetical protein R3F14_09520 [Polyangiaceae bacterium]
MEVRDGARPPGIAAPESCRLRAPLLKASVEAPVRFVSDGRTLGELVVAEMDGEGRAVVRSGHLACAADGACAAGAWAPWPAAPSVVRRRARGAVGVRVGRAARWGHVRGGVVEGGARVVVRRRGWVRGGGSCVWGVEVRDAHEPRGARDAVRGGGRRARSVERRGSADDHDRSRRGSSAARPFGIAEVDRAGGPVVVLADAGDAVFWVAASEPGPSELARVTVEHGMLDVAMLGEVPLVMAHGNVVDEQGCAREGADPRGARVLFARPGQPPREVISPGAPSSAELRPLARGALATWAAPLGCGAERSVVHGVVLDGSGAPVSAPLPIGDGEAFAVASSGADVDLWIRHADQIAWVRMTCEAPSAKAPPAASP